MGATHYRLSIAWSRIMPTGRLPLNPDGVAYYNDVLNTAIENGLEPFVTLYHWDYPQVDMNPLVFLGLDHQQPTHPSRAVSLIK